MARKHSRRNLSKKNKNILNKGMESMKSTSRKYIPKVKTSIENVGSKVTTTARQSVPFLQKSMRKLFRAFSTKKNRKH
jgi:hypothetical protein